MLLATKIHFTLDDVGNFFGPVLRQLIVSAKLALAAGLSRETAYLRLTTDPPPERAFGDTDGYVAGVRLWGGTFGRYPIPYIPTRLLRRNPPTKKGGHAQDAQVHELQKDFVRVDLTY